MPTKKTVTQAPKELAIPADLLRSFKTDIRFLPVNPGTRGYIMFDRAMLIAALRSSNIDERKTMATQLEALGRAGGELVIMQQ